jgi:hypothetical protein
VLAAGRTSPWSPNVGTITSARVRACVKATEVLAVMQVTEFVYLVSTAGHLLAAAADAGAWIASTSRDSAG